MYALNGRATARALARAVVLFVFLVPSSLLAEELVLPLAGYHAPADCPSGTVFSDQVAARTRLWREADELSVRVEIRSVPEGVYGEVSLERDGRRTVREIAAPRCDEVVRALALIVAILIDPLADTRPIPVSARAPASRPAETPKAVPQRQWFAFAGVELAFEGGFAPGLSPGLRVFGGAIRRSPAALVSSLRVSAFHERSGTVPAGGTASAAFQLTGGRLELCSFGFAGGAFRATPCLFGELAALAAEGNHPEGAGSETVVWGALGPSVRAAVNYAKVLFFELEAGAMVPLVTYRFRFLGEPDPVYETPSLAPVFSAGVGVRFP